MHTQLRHSINVRCWQLSGTVDGQERIQRLELDLEQDRHGINRLSRRLALGPTELGEAGLRVLLRLPTQASSSYTELKSSCARHDERIRNSSLSVSKPCMFPRFILVCAHACARKPSRNCILYFRICSDYSRIKPAHFSY